MNKKPDSMIYAMALGGLILAGVITTAIINAVKSNQGTATDIRAKAGVVSTLKLIGIVDHINDTDGTIVVNNVQFASESRSGKAVNYGTWIVTPPATFSILSAIPGNTITFTINSDSFDVATKKVVAAQVSVAK